MEPLSCDAEAQEPAGEDRTIGAGFDFTSPDSPLAPYYLRASDVLAVALLCLVFVLLSMAPLWHTDIWGHLATGRWIVAHGPWPAGDQFCAHADAQSTFGSVYWLSQAGLYLIFHAGELTGGTDPQARLQAGVEMLQTTQALLAAGRLALLFLAFRRLTGSPRAGLAGLVVVLAFSLGHIGVMRPQAIGELFFALLLFLLARTPLSPRALWGIPVVLVVWANCHGFFVVGLALLGLCLLGRCWQLTGWRCWRVGPALGDAQARRLTVSLGASLLLIALFNPRGPWVFLDTWRMARHPNVLFMDEWQPLALGLGKLGPWLFAVNWLLVLLPPLLTRRSYSPDRWLLLLFFGLQPLLHQRAMLWWVMVSPWCALSLGRELLQCWPASLRWSASVPSFRKTLLAGGALLLAGLWLAPVRWLTGSASVPLERCLSPGTPWRLASLLQGESSDQASAYPKLQAVLRENYPQGRFCGMVFASETLADYLVWTGPEPAPVLIYSHVHLFAPESWRRCLHVKFGRPGWAELLDQEGVNLVLVEAELHPFLRAELVRRPGWTVVLDETGDPRKPWRCRWLLAVRTKPGKSGSLGSP